MAKKRNIWRHPVTVLVLGIVGLTVVGPAVVRELGIGEKRESKYKAVNVYGSSWCPACMQLKEDFTDSGIDHAFRNIDRDRSANAFIMRTTDEGVIPVVTIRGQTIVGYDKPKIEEALGVSLGESA